MIARVIGPVAAGLATAALGIGVAGCGSSTVPVTATQGALVTEHAGAHEMFREMSRALRRVHSVSIDLRLRLNRGPALVITSEIEIPGRVEATVTSGGLTVNERFVGDAVYLRYNVGALLALTGNASVAETESGRWIGLPDSEVPLAASVRHIATHAMLQQCDVLGPHGRLTVDGPSTVDGLPSVSILDHGGLPGTARRRIVLSANPPYLPLRILQKQPARPGGSAKSACFVGQAKTMMRRALAVARAFDRKHHITLRSYNQTIGRYDQPLHLTAPTHPLLPHSSQAGTANSVAV